MKRTGIWQSFLLLLLAAFTVAAVSGSLAVRITAVPLLAQIKNDTLQTQADASADGIARELGQMHRELGYLSRDPAVISAVLSGNSRRALGSERIRRFAELRKVPRVMVFDTLVFKMSEAGVRNAESMFSSLEFELLARRAINPSRSSGPTMFYRSATDGKAFLIALPVVRDGETAGAIVAEFPYDFGSVVAETDFARTVEIVGPSANRVTQTDLIVAPIAGSPFSLVIEPNAKASAALGSELIRSVTLAILCALALPFLLLVLGGRSTIVMPHIALQNSRENLRRSERRLAEFGRVVSTTSGAVVMSDREGRATWVNRSFVELTGYTSAEVLGKRPGDLLNGPRTDREAAEALRRAVREGGSLKAEVVQHRKDGTPFWNSISLNPLIDETGATYGCFTVSHDISVQRRREEQLVAAKEEIEHQANHDPLTDLPNRRYVDRVLERRRGEAKTLIRIDLDHFKHVNDTLGHAAGDALLCHVAGILTHATEAGDVAARVGGDEFIMILGPGYDSTAAMDLAEGLSRDIREEVTIAGKRCRVGASFGIASSRDDLLENQELLACADTALYIAKERGRSKVVPYTKDVHATILHGRTIASEIELGLARREFVPVFQPQFDAKSHVITGMETLLRWRHPQRGVLTPDMFLAIADQMSVVPDIDAQIFEKSLAIVEGLNRDGLWVPKVSFNVTAPRLEDRSLIETFRAANLGTTTVAIELLETVLVEEEPHAFFFHLDALREIGFEIEIDDFGSGHASIIGLGRVMPDAMKIDRRLVMPIADSETSRNMVASIIEMARHLGIKVTAEGVETEEHARILADLGCDVLQGYWFSRPLDEAGLRELLASGAGKARKAARTGTGP